MSFFLSHNNGPAPRASWSITWTFRFKPLPRLFCRLLEVATDTAQVHQVSRYSALSTSCQHHYSSISINHQRKKRWRVRLDSHFPHPSGSQTLHCHPSGNCTASRLWSARAQLCCSIPQPMMNHFGDTAVDLRQLARLRHD